MADIMRGGSMTINGRPPGPWIEQGQTNRQTDPDDWITPGQQQTPDADRNRGLNAIDQRMAAIRAELAQLRAEEAQATPDQQTTLPNVPEAAGANDILLLHRDLDGPNGNQIDRQQRRTEIVNVRFANFEQTPNEANTPTGESRTRIRAGNAVDAYLALRRTRETANQNPDAGRLPIDQVLNVRDALRDVNEVTEYWNYRLRLQEGAQHFINNGTRPSTRITDEQYNRMVDFEERQIRRLAEQGATFQGRDADTIVAQMREYRDLQRQLHDADNNAGVRARYNILAIQPEIAIVQQNLNRNVQSYFSNERFGEIGNALDLATQYQPNVNRQLIATLPDTSVGAHTVNRDINRVYNLWDGQQLNPIRQEITAYEQANTALNNHVAALEQIAAGNGAGTNPNAFRQLRINQLEGTLNTLQAQRDALAATTVDRVVPADQVDIVTPNGLRAEAADLRRQSTDLRRQALEAIQAGRTNEGLAFLIQADQLRDEAHNAEMRARDQENENQITALNQRIDQLAQREQQRQVEDDRRRHNRNKIFATALGVAAGGIAVVGFGAPVLAVAAVGFGILSGAGVTQVLSGRRREQLTRELEQLRNNPGVSAEIIAQKENQIRNMEQIRRWAVYLGFGGGGVIGGAFLGGLINNVMAGNGLFGNASGVGNELAGQPLKQTVTNSANYSGVAQKAITATGTQGTTGVTEIGSQVAQNSVRATGTVWDSLLNYAQSQGASAAEAVDIANKFSYPWAEANNLARLSNGVPLVPQGGVDMVLTPEIIQAISTAATN